MMEEGADKQISQRDDADGEEKAKPVLQTMELRHAPLKE